MVPHEFEFDGTVDPVLEEFCAAAGLEGLVVLDLGGSGGAPVVVHRSGFGSPSVMDEGRTLLMLNPDAPAHGVASDRRPILVCPWTTPPARAGGAVLWRAPRGARWRESDHALAGGLAVLLRTFLATGNGQVGIDRLTGLPNRRWFLDEVDRHLDRMLFGGGIGTLTVIEVANFAQIRAASGRDVAQTFLVRLAAQLRARVRPGDAVARVDTAQFGLWQPAMDHLTAAERAHELCTEPPPPDMPSGMVPRLAIGIAARAADSAEDVRALLQRAIAEVAELRRQEAGGWRVSRGVPLLPRRPDDMKS
ncbi:GGDEF domain-containing protein [Rhodopila sp.]|uniref:GGDEF domain-containing protein n=1 Tax=Rhodopila sp. TaxID=2480087 RepID=UPI002C11DA0E|nr:GGDEF domain-containing protein [Rhodopila sp.]HVZ07243.1 GGDEF domain-containing protein [Rhodopila sp.]